MRTNVLIENNAFDKLLFGQGSIRIDIYLRKNVPAMDNKLHSLRYHYQGSIDFNTANIYRTVGMGLLIHP